MRRFDFPLSRSPESSPALSEELTNQAIAFTMAEFELTMVSERRLWQPFGD
jgi:hypothetical protein